MEKAPKKKLNIELPPASAARPEEARNELLKLLPLGRLGEPEDVADAVLFLAGDSSRYITGTVLKVDGGMYV